MIHLNFILQLLDLPGGLTIFQKAKILCAFLVSPDLTTCSPCGSSLLDFILLAEQHKDDKDASVP
jgi:hypothetical protein